MARNFGFSKLADQIADYLASEWEWQSTTPNQMVGDTPIEKLLFAALELRSRLGCSEFSDLVIARSSEHLEKLKAGAFLNLGTDISERMIVWPQAPLESGSRRRVDFRVFVMDSSSAERDRWSWRQLIVECDGHDFHERTKEQATRDRSRDRLTVLDGHDVFRFTGSEVWGNPWGCAEQICSWAAKYFSA